MHCIPIPGIAKRKYPHQSRNASGNTRTFFSVPRSVSDVAKPTAYMLNVPMSTSVNPIAAPSRFLNFRMQKNGAINFNGVVHTLSAATRRLRFIASIVFSITHVAHCKNNPGTRHLANRSTRSAVSASTPATRKIVPLFHHVKLPGAHASVHSTAIPRANVSPTTSIRPIPFACALIVSTPDPSPQTAACPVTDVTTLPSPNAAVERAPETRDTSDS